MAINRVDYPTDLSTQSDFSDHGDLIETRYLDQSYHPLQVVSGNIPQGTVFQVGGVVYRADSDTAVSDANISGTSSDYVKIVPNGATATAEYAEDLTGVSWAAQYNGYYDGSGNLYIFDEGKALQNTAITAIMSRYLMQTTDGDVYVGRNVIAKKVNTGHGDNELYAMNQPVRTSDNVTFSRVNTGQGDNELYPMDQGVRSSDSPVFAARRVPEGGAVNDDDVTEGQLYTVFAPIVDAASFAPIADDGVAITGGIFVIPGQGGDSEFIIVSRILRQDPSSLYILGVRMTNTGDGERYFITINENDSSIVGGISNSINIRL